MVRLLDVLIKLLPAFFHCLEIAEILGELVLLSSDEFLVLGDIVVRFIAASLESPDGFFGVKQLSLDPILRAFLIGGLAKRFEGLLVCIFGLLSLLVSLTITLLGVESL